MNIYVAVEFVDVSVSRSCSFSCGILQHFVIWPWPAAAAACPHGLYPLYWM